VTHNSRQTRLGFLQEPLVHFLAIGAVIFAVYAVTAADEAPEDERQLVRVTDAQLDRAAAQFEKTWRRAPVKQELEGMVDAMIRQEILVRQALELGLDQGDEIVRRRLAQKMEFLLSSAATAATPDETVLRAFFEEQADRYTTSEQFAFEGVFLGETATEAEVMAARAALARGDLPETVGQPTLLPGQNSLSGQPQIDAIFGRGFTAQLAGLEPGVWSAPLRSAYGVHLVRLTERVKSQVPPFEDVQRQVAIDWQRERGAEATEELIKKLQDQYQVLTPDLDDRSLADG